MIAGLQRSWSYKCPRGNYTAVTVDRIPGAFTNGVLIPLHSPSQDLISLDEREVCYSRGLVPLHDVYLRTEETTDLSNAVIWVYENHNTLYPNFNSFATQIVYEESSHQPTSLCPIPRSYIDVILAGCLQFSVDFARDFISTTRGWNEEAYLDDRFLECKKYICRNQLSESMCRDTVDSLLASVFSIQPFSGGRTA